MEPTDIARVKKYAKYKGLSVSKLVEDYLSGLELFESENKFVNKSTQESTI